jgi:hypothetical protein
MTPDICRRLALPILMLCGTLGSLGACSATPSRAAHATAAERVACRAHTDDVFSRQNRNAVYRSDSYSTDLRDTPFATSGMPGLTTSGLSQQYGIENTMQDCLNGTGDAPAATEAAPPGTPAVSTKLSTGAPAPATVK